MSSHHVVRENQEPAVLFLNAENCNSAILNEALEWSPLVIATAESYQYLIQQNIKVDIIFCDSQLFSKNLDQSDIDLIFFEGEILSSVFKFLKNREHHALYIFSNSLEPILKILPEPISFTINVFEGNKRWMLVSSSIKKWFPKNRQVMLRGEVVKVYRDHDELSLKEISPTTDTGIITFNSDKPFWLGEVLA